MASGQQVGEENYQAFTTWLASRTHEDFKQMVIRGILSRKEIAAQCGFGVSALNQNPRIKFDLAEKEKQLRANGVLPPRAISTNADDQAAPMIREPGSAGRSLEAARLRRLEEENASLKAENGQLKRELERYAVLREVLAETGRLPR